MKHLLLILVLALGMCSINVSAQTTRRTPVRKTSSTSPTTATTSKYRQLGQDGYIWYKVKKGKFFGAEDAEGKEIVPALYDDVEYECQNYKESYSDWSEEFSTKWFHVKNGDNSGYYDIKGKCLISTDRYSGNYRIGIPVIDVHYMEKMYLYISKDNKIGVLDMQGREVIPPIYDQIHNNGFSYMSGRVQNEGKRYGAFMIVDQSYPRWGFTDLNGKIILYPSENKLGAVLGIHDNGILYISKRIEEGLPGKWADTNYDYDENIRFDYSQSSPILAKMFTKQYDSFITANDGRTLYVKKLDGNWSVMDADKNVIIPSSKGYAQVNLYSISNENWGFYIKKSGKWGIADRLGKEIVAPRYDAISVIDVNRVKFKANGFWGLMDMVGNILIPIERGYSLLEKCGDSNSYKVSKSGRYGMVNSEGREIVPVEMEALESAGAGYLRYKLAGFWGLMNYSGKILIDTDRGYTSIGDYISFTKRFPYTMNGYKGECNSLGVQVSKIKVSTSQQLPQQQAQQQQTTQGQQTQTIVVEHHRDPVPVQQWQACFACGGMGTMGCDNCGGGGTKYIGDRLHRCSRCNGQGIIPCNVCYGNKGQYITVYQ